MSAPSILIIHRRSAFTEATDLGGAGSVSRLLQRRDPLVREILAAHDHHGRAMDAIRRDLERRGLAAQWRYDLSGVSPDDFDLVITIGGDGTVLHASHSIGDTPVLAINSSPATSVGYFTAGGAKDFPGLMDGVLSGDLEPHRLFRMSVARNGEMLNTRVLNDALFSHDCPASTTRYVLQCPDGEEAQLSSGIWISTAAGSTAAIRAAGGRAMRAGSRRLQFAVREPGPFGGAERPATPGLVRGFVRHSETLSIRSMTTAARVWIDGPHVVVPVEFGDILTFSGGARPLMLFGYRMKNNS
jgi:NAD+ kinase